MCKELEQRLKSDLIIENLNLDGTKAKYQEEMAKAYQQDLAQKILRINADRFRNYMNTYEKKKKTRISHLREPFLIGLTLIITLTSSTFNDALGFKKEFWQGIFLCSFIIVLCCLIYFAIKFFINKGGKDDIDNLIDKIYSQTDDK
jgi:hypothetical protein